MFEVNFFPIYGAMVGVNYWNEDLSMEENNNDDTQHMIQLMFLIFFFFFVWYKKNNYGI